MLIHLYLFSFQELNNCENIRDLAGNNFEQIEKIPGRIVSINSQLLIVGFCFRD